MLHTYFRAILDNNPESIVLIGKNHEVLAFNSTIKDVLFQYHNKVIKEGDLYYPDFVIEANRALYLEAFESAINGVSYSVHNLTKNENASYWFEYLMQPVYNENDLIGVTLSAKNITKEKIAELKILDITEKLKAILDNTDESITLLDLDYKILTMNEVAAQTAERNTSSELLVGRDIRDFIPHEENPFYNHYHNALQGETSLVVISYQNFSGDVVWYQTKFNPVYDQHGRLFGVSIFAKDITENKKLEAALKESEDRFRKIADLAPIGIFITDGKLAITYANVYAKNLFKYSDDDLTNVNLTELIENINLYADNQLIVDSAVINIDDSQFNSEQFTALTKDQNKLNILLSSTIFKNLNQDNFIFVIQDISELKNKTSIIEGQNKKLKEIAWHQSHIIRAPLARLMGIIHLLQTNKVEEVEKNYFLDAILKSAEELDAVIKDIVKTTK